MVHIDVEVHKNDRNNKGKQITAKHFDDNDFVFYNNNYNKKIYNDNLMGYESTKIEYSHPFDKEIEDSINIDFNNINDYEIDNVIDENLNPNDNVLHYADGTIITDKEGQPIKNKGDFSDDEIDIYNLDDEEKAEVYQGNFNPWDFEEDDMDEESYYYEDDLK